MANPRAHDAPLLIALAGPTASGKSAAALSIAQEIDAEIISVDSALVYRSMDIGTAKPTSQELAAVPHHLIDILDPSQTYSAAQFVADASRLTQEVRARGKSVLLVGGTMLYFKSLFDGLAAMPPADAQIRAAVEQEARTQGWPAMHAQLAQLDPVTAARLAPNDSQRIQRALEVQRITGQPLSHFHENAQRSPGLKPDLFLSLEPADRMWLHERIAQRFGDMLNAGFVDEVRRLRARGDLIADLPSMRCVGYRQAWEALDGLWPMDELRDKGVFATRQLAKRQITWLRSMPQRQIIACDSPDTLKQLMKAIEGLS